MSEQGGWTQPVNININIDFSKPREETIDKMFPELNPHPDLYVSTKHQLNNKFGIDSERNDESVSDKNTVLIKQEYIINWLDDFVKDMTDNGKTDIDDKFLDALARALCDDIPLGYEASCRLASWIFGYLNNQKLKEKLL